MPKFTYTGRDPSGNLISGEVEAISQQAAIDQLFLRHIIPLNVTSPSKWLDVKQWSNVALGSPVKTDDLAFFCRQMYALLKAGLPLMSALDLLAQTSHSKFLTLALRAIIDSLKTGRPFAASLAEHPKIFQPFFVNLVEVGEKTGHLDSSFLELSDFLVFQAKTKKQFLTAVRYPFLVIVTMFLSLGVITIFVIPKLTGLFSQFDAELPWITRMVVGFSDFLRHYFLWVLLGLGATVGGFIFFLRTYVGRLIYDRLLLKLPVIGRIVFLMTMSRFAHIFSILLRSGVPMVETSELVGKTMNNAYYERALQKIAERSRHGESYFELIRSDTELFSPFVRQMVGIGEETGAVDELLVEAAEYYDREVDYNMKRIQDLIQPILLVVVGGLLLILVLSILLPILKLTLLMAGGAGANAGMLG